MKNAVEAYPTMMTVTLTPCIQCGDEHKSRVIRQKGTESENGNSCTALVECPEGDYEANFTVGHDFDRPTHAPDHGGDDE